ncbi:hypothetical protein M0811_03584 [Anaeramoeba ignava]|uniref:Uncharacterized protein n=1 Tax=Anaeramoeba ignava TaxID=1746090 RepID=A0A9Q0R4S3_ANAIG|nr:hypothetical protein M0811_03584 [Anaeramoeba ignava]
MNPRETNSEINQEFNIETFTFGNERPYQKDYFDETVKLLILFKKYHKKQIIIDEKEVRFIFLAIDKKTFLRIKVSKEISHSVLYIYSSLFIDFINCYQSDMDLCYYERNELSKIYSDIGIEKDMKKNQVHFPSFFVSLEQKYKLLYVIQRMEILRDSCFFAHFCIFYQDSLLFSSFFDPRLSYLMLLLSRLIQKRKKKEPNKSYFEMDFYFGKISKRKKYDHEMGVDDQIYFKNGNFDSFDPNSPIKTYFFKREKNKKEIGFLFISKNKIDTISEKIQKEFALFPNFDFVVEDDSIIETLLVDKKNISELKRNVFDPNFPEFIDYSNQIFNQEDDWLYLK